MFLYRDIETPQVIVLWNQPRSICTPAGICISISFTVLIIGLYVILPNFAPNTSQLVHYVALEACVRDLVALSTFATGNLRQKSRNVYGTSSIHGVKL